MKNLFRKIIPLVEVGQRWQDKSFYNHEVDPFNPSEWWIFIVTIKEIKDGWIKGTFEDGSGPYTTKISDLRFRYKLLKDNECIRLRAQ